MRSWRTRGKFQAKIGRMGNYLCRGQWGLVTGVRKLGLCSGNLEEFYVAGAWVCGGREGDMWLERLGG